MIIIILSIENGPAATKAKASLVILRQYDFLQFLQWNIPIKNIIPTAYWLPECDIMEIIKGNRKGEFHVGFYSADPDAQFSADRHDRL